MFAFQVIHRFQFRPGTAVCQRSACPRHLQETGGLQEGPDPDLPGPQDFTKDLVDPDLPKPSHTAEPPLAPKRPDGAMV